MKKTIWLPLLFGIAMGVLAGLVNIGNLTYMSPTGWPVGFYNVFLFLAAALGGWPGAISEIIMITIINSLGPLEWREAIGPAMYWANVVTEAIFLLPLMALGYQALYKRFSMPMRLLPWAGLIITFYALDVVIIRLLHWLFEGRLPDAVLMSKILAGYQSWIPQVISDLLLTSLIWLALPEKWRRPFWSPVEGTRRGIS
jgi:hypothetical protein